MIKYRERITVKQNRNYGVVLETDAHDNYDTTVYSSGSTQITDWSSQRAQSELSEWQKDIAVYYTADVFGRLDLFVPYKRGYGYKQDTGVCLVRTQIDNFWILSTPNDFWIQQAEPGTSITFHRKDSLGSILDQSTRLRLGKLFDQIKANYNPENNCQWVRY